MPGSCCKSSAIVGEIAAVFSDNFLGCGVQLPSAAIVAKSFPQPQNFGLIGGRQRVDIGKRASEAIEVIAYRRHLRLLQHDLAEPHAIRIARPAPGQIALMRGVPSQKPATQRLSLRRSEEGRLLVELICVPSRPCMDSHAKAQRRKGPNASVAEFFAALRLCVRQVSAKC